MLEYSQPVLVVGIRDNPLSFEISGIIGKPYTCACVQDFPALLWYHDNRAIENVEFWRLVDSVMNGY